MKILFLTFYFEPDLSAGSFRNSSLLKLLDKESSEKVSKIDVITTHPNRYDSFSADAKSKEALGNKSTIYRITVPNHKGGLLKQIMSYKQFYTHARRMVKNEEYDLVYASSSKLFTAFLGARVAKSKNAKLYLDIRDIFRESIVELFESSFIKFVLNVLLLPVERYTFSRANHINLVSEGFKSYFLKFSKPSFSYFTNGIDEVFLNKNYDKKNISETSKSRVIYGGNIGEGQGLDKVIPILARELVDYRFVIYGDGGCKQKLIDALEQNDIQNVEVNAPITRDELIKEYEKSDYLFLHLNDYKAFERVLPSKLFEYGSYDLPVIAGVGGYAAKFLQKKCQIVLYSNLKQLEN